jgi:hypothetical protein
MPNVPKFRVGEAYARAHEAGSGAGGLNQARDPRGHVEGLAGSVEAFKSIDLNGDGNYSFDELKAAKKKAGDHGDGLTQGFINKLIKLADAIKALSKDDKDGDVSIAFSQEDVKALANNDLLSTGDIKLLKESV